MPVACNHDILHVGGEVFGAGNEPSDQAVFWGECLCEKERVFFRKELNTEIASFSIKDTFQISVRCLWQPTSRTRAGHRPGCTIALIHSLEFPFTTSWTWMKLARPLYKSGFSVIMIDLPGFGRSKMNMDPNVKLKDWKYQDWHILSQILDELRALHVLTICMGQICGTILRILMRSPHTLGKEHIFFDPCFDPHEVLSDLAGEVPPGAGSNWRQKMRVKYLNAMETILRSSKARIWCMHDRDRMTKSVFDTVSLFSDLLAHPVLGQRIRISELSKKDACSCHVGAKLPFSFLYLRKSLLEEIVEFFIRREKADPILAMPRYNSADPRYSELNWAPWMSPKFHAQVLAFTDYDAPEEVLLDAENPLRPLMRKAKKREFIKSEAALLGTSKKSQSSLLEDGEEDGNEQLLKPTLARARHRAGPEAAKHIEWCDYSQTKHQVRKIHSRNDCSMFKSASDAFNLTGGGESAEGFRVGLISKLSPTQRTFVNDHQSLEFKEEEENPVPAAAAENAEKGGSKEQGPPRSRNFFKGISASEMSAALARSRAGRPRTGNSQLSDLSDGDLRPTSTNQPLAVGTLPPTRSPPMSASSSRRPTSTSMFSAIDETSSSKKSMLLPPMSKSMPNLSDVRTSGSRSSTRSKSNLALSEGSGDNGNIEDPLQSRPRTTNTESRSSSTLSSGGLAKNKRSRSNISVTLVEPPKEDDVEAVRDRESAGPPPRRIPTRNNISFPLLEPPMEEEDV